MKGILAEKRLAHVQFYVCFVDELMPDESTGKKRLFWRGRWLYERGAARRKGYLQGIPGKYRGMVYYSEPNRIIPFYQDAEVAAEYTPVGYFDYKDQLSLLEEQRERKVIGNQNH